MDTSHIRISLRIVMPCASITQRGNELSLCLNRITTNYKPSSKVFASSSCDITSPIRDEYVYSQFPHEQHVFNNKFSFFIESIFFLNIFCHSAGWLKCGLRHVRSYLTCSFIARMKCSHTQMPTVIY